MTVNTIDTMIDGLFNDNANATAESKSVLSSTNNPLTIGLSICGNFDIPLVLSTSSTW